MIYDESVALENKRKTKLLNRKFPSLRRLYKHFKVYILLSFPIDLLIFLLFIILLLSLFKHLLTKQPLNFKVYRSFEVNLISKLDKDKEGLLKVFPPIFPRLHSSGMKMISVVIAVFFVSFIDFPPNYISQLFIYLLNDNFYFRNTTVQTTATTTNT